MHRRSVSYRRVVLDSEQKEPQSFDTIMFGLGGAKGKMTSLGDRRSSSDAQDAAYAAEVMRLKKRLSAANRLLLNPRSKEMQYWDMCTLSALFFTATVTPYEVCLIWAPTEVDALFVINNLVNLIFMIDMVFIFFLPYTVKHDQPVKNHRLIARRYLRGWFGLDLLSIAPLDWLVVTKVLDTEAVNPSMLKMVRMIRLLRLIKLARILRASRIFSRWENSISLQYSTRALIRWILTIIMTLHWFSCLLGLLAQMQGSLRTVTLENAVGARMAIDPTCYGCNQTVPALNDAFCGDLTP